MAVQLVGYALWYYEHVVAPRGGFIQRMVNRTLLDLEGTDLRDAEVNLCDAALAEVAISAAMSLLKIEEPALWRRLTLDLGAAAKSGGQLKIVVVRFRQWLPPKRVSIRLGVFEEAGDDVVFWMSTRWVRKL